MENLTNFEKAEKYLNGDGSTRDINKALIFFEKAVEADSDPVALLRLHSIFKNPENECFSEARASFWKARWDYADGNYEAACNSFNTLVNDNNDLQGDAHYWLARCYDEGAGTDVDESNAFTLYRDAAGLGNTDSYYIVGDLLLSKGKDKQALLYLLASAELGNANSMTLLGLYNFADEEIGIEYLKKAAEDGSGAACYHLGTYYYEGTRVKRDVPLAIKYFTKSFETDQELEPILKLIEIFQNDTDFKDDALANYWEGMHYHQMPSNEAFSYFENASNKKNLESIYWLGHYYLNGFGSIVNVKKAVELLEEAAEGGNEKAVLELAELYFYKEHGVQDYEKAFNYYLKAAEHHNLTANFMVALMYDQGLVGEDSDIVKAFPFMLKAAKLGHPDALYFIGDYYENGYVVEQNNEKSFEYYLRAAFAGSADGCRLVGEAFHNGFGVEENLQEALKWYLRGAELNDLSSINDVIECYEKGIGTEINTEEAEFWKSKADKIRKNLE